MKKLLLLPALGLLLLPFLGQRPATSPLARAASETYRVDAVHSAIHFKVEHAGASYSWGRFNDFAGTFVLDTEDPSKSMIAIEVVAASVDTNNEARDKHLRNEDFFDVKVHPKITFESSKVVPKGDDYAVTGTLSFLGQQREVTLMATLIGRNEAGGQHGTVAGLDAELTIKRTDFGNATYVDGGMLGDDVHLMISLEGKLQD